jgi:hypothetical protein
MIKCPLKYQSMALHTQAVQHISLGKHEEAEYTAHQIIKQISYQKIVDPANDLDLG